MFTNSPNVIIFSYNSTLNN